MMTRFFYTLLLWLALPYIAVHLWLRSRKQPEYLEHVAERFGRCTRFPSGRRGPRQP